jgi:hypothetical protein
MTTNTKAVLMYGGIAAGVIVLAMLLKKKSSASAIVTAKNSAAGIPAANLVPVTAGSLGNTASGGAQYVDPGVKPLAPADTDITVINTPAGVIKSAPMYFATPTADALYYAPQNIY